MNDIKQKRIAREEAILLSLKECDYLTRSQLQKLHHLKSVRNAQRVLKQMEAYLHHFKDGQNIYYLNSKGRELVDCSTERKRISNVNHYIMRNDLYIAYGCPGNWENEIRIISEGKTGKIVVVSDAIFKRNNKFYIVEIDNLQKMKKNRIKAEKYRRLIERNVFKGMPKLVWVTTSPYRKRVLMELCEGLDVDVYLNTDFN